MIISLFFLKRCLKPLFIKSLWKPRLTHSRWLDAWALSRRTLTVVVEALPRDFKTRSWTQQTVIGEYLRSSFDSELFNVCWRLYSEFKKNVVRTSDKEIKKRFYSNICKRCFQQFWKIILESELTKTDEIA
jgi:hypothetical protein